MSEASDIPRTAIEQRVIDEHTGWMRDNAFGLRMLELTQTMGTEVFGNEILRNELIDSMGAQIAVDAFKRGLSVIALSAPKYLVHRHLGAWADPDRVIVPESIEWLSAPPPASMLEPRTLIEIKIEAYGFPIGKREV